MIDSIDMVKRFLPKNLEELRQIRVMSINNSFLKTETKIMT